MATLSEKEPEHSTFVPKTSKTAVEHKHPAPGSGHGAKLSDVLAEYLLKLKPLIVKASELLDKGQPYFDKGVSEINKGWTKLQPYHPEEFVPLLIGLTLVLGGGIFPVLIATVEAVRASGTWPGIQSSFKALANNYRGALSASHKDDQLDEDRDGVPDVKQIPASALLQRKGLVLIKSINTEQVNVACQQLATALFAVLATLRLRLAKALTLGASLSSVANTWGAGPVAIDAVAKALPDDSKRLAPLIVNGTLRTLGFVVAWILYRPVTAFYAAMRGAQMLVAAGIDYMQRNGTVAKDSPLIQYRALIGGLIGFAGFFWQFSQGFTLPFVLRFFLFPFSAAEAIASLTFGVLA